jgi:hypothetical protein
MEEGDPDIGEHPAHAPGEGLFGVCIRAQLRRSER